MNFTESNGVLEVDNIEESILEFPLDISSNLHEDIFGDRNA